jgi:DNA-binding NtrC family response regulator
MTQTQTGVSHRVLLVDDDEGVRDVMRETLQAKGVDVVPAGNVREAMATLQ